MGLIADLTAIFSDLTGKTAAVKATEMAAAIGGGFKLGSFTRDLTTASGSVNITDVGFQPSVVIFLSGLSSYSSYVGMDDSINHFMTGTYSASYFLYNTRSILIRLAVGDHQSAYISSMLSNGFTVNWTKTGSPTGTESVYYLALKLAT